MKTQCPHCKTEQDMPDEYENREIKCLACKKQFVVQEFHKPPIVVPDYIARKGGNFIGRIWKGSPKAFRTGFLATIGVISALTLCVYVYGRIFLPRQSFKPEPIYPPSISTRSVKINTATTTTNFTADNVYALVMLFHYGKGLEALQHVRASLCDSALADINTFKALPVIVKPILSQLKDNVSQLTRLNMPQDSRFTNPSFGQVQSAYIDAMYAEIDVMNELIRATKTGIFVDNWPDLIKRTNDLGIEATFKLVSLMFQMDKKMAEAVSDAKK